MIDEMRELYQEVILQHKKHPRNFGAIEHPDARNEGYNPLCGDHITLTLKLDGDTVTDARFEGDGCAISTASASMMTEAVKGRTRAEAQALWQAFHDLITKEGDPDEALLGRLAVFSGVWEFPARVKCALLPWHSLKAALDGQSTTVTTE